MPDYDVLVIGAGINGAGVAQAAAAAGHKVLLLDKEAPAAGTSSRSSKLIHGGLRYLESFEFGLVRESLHERSLLLKLAPDLVQLKDFYIPVYEETRRSRLLLRTGLSLYWMLAAGGPGSSFESLPRKRWHDLDGLRTEGLKGVFRYQDAQTDDVLLTRAVVASATRLGAEVVFPARVEAVHLQKNSCQVDYRCEDRELSVSATIVVNAAGPWANEVLGRVTPAVTALPMELVRGSHIIVERLQSVDSAHAGFYYVESPKDGRAVFIMPWQGNVLVGTTEGRYRGEPDNVRPLPQEIRYLTDILKHYFPLYQSRAAEKPQQAFAGLRVLPGGEGHVFHRSRELILHPGRPSPAGPLRLLTLYGGKLTVWRATGEKAMKMLAPSLPRSKSRIKTSQLPLF